MKQALIILFLLLIQLSVWGQNKRTISGKVLNKSDGSTLIGASIRVNNTLQGTITDFDGNFTLNVSVPDTNNITLTVSFVGMIDQEINPGTKNYIVVYLEENVNELKQFVVTSSYGTQKLKEEIVGSITTIGANDIDVEQASESIDKMLDGQIAGVLMEPSSTINGPVKIDIRGQGSLSPMNNAVLGTSMQPLIIIDGVIMGEETGIDNTFFDGAGLYSENFQNPLAQISPDDIETFTVLKDAAAVGIYGADGANGVILITTKKGKRGKINIGFSSQFGFSEAINRIQYLNGEQYTELRNEFLTNSGQPGIEYNGINTDWYNLLNQNGTFQRYNLNISGGKNKFTYRSSLSFIDIEEPQPGNNSYQYRMSNSLGYKNDKLSISLTANPSFLVKDAPNNYYAYAFPPNIAAYNEDGSFADLVISNLGNPLAAIEQNLNNTQSFALLSSLNADYNILNNLNISSTFGIDYKSKTQDRYFSGANGSGQYNRTFLLDGVSYPQWGRRVINLRNSSKWNWQARLAYNETIMDIHHIDLIGGVEIAEDRQQYDYKSGVGFVNPDIINPVNAAIQDDDPETIGDDTLNNQVYDNDKNVNSRVSAFTQFNYDYNKKYFFLVNFRRDESSVFGDDVDVAYNYSAGLSWLISNEAFLKDVNAIKMLRFRISYGKTGNSRIGSYRASGLYITDKPTGYNNITYAFINTNAPPNTLLSWESNYKFNAGIDIDLLNRLSLVVEYYYDDIRDMITNRDIPEEIGFNGAQINGADMYNKGIELGLKSKLVKRNNFTWDLSLNYSTLENKITRIEGLGDEYSGSEKALALKTGSSTSAIWGINFAGIDPATGKVLVKYDGQIYDYATYDDLFDETNWEIIGNSMPQLYGGFRSDINIYKRLNISFSGRYKYNYDKLVQKELTSHYNVTTNRNLSINALDRWRNPGDIALLPVASKTVYASNISNNLYDASHIKLNNINVSYRVPLGQYHKWIKHLSLLVDVSNVYYFYFNKSPEGRNGIREFMFNYPEARTWTACIKMTF